MQAAGGRHVAHSTWREVERAILDGATAVLPVGAACKEHGLHLPMASDWLQAEWLAARLVERYPVLAWPTLGYGYYPAFVEYPGSVSIQRDTFLAVVGDILAGIAAAGARSCLVVNTGVSTITPLREAVATAQAAGMPTRLASLGEGAHYLEARRRVEQQRRGGHADECETSVMLVIDEAGVRMGEARPADAVAPEPGPLRRHDAGARNHSPTGAYGDPTLATARKGSLLLEAMLADLAGHLRVLRPAGGRPRACAT